jgi:superfamily I DNA and/or RNA helicase
MDKMLSTKTKNPRAITMANTWKQKEIAIVLGLRDEMIQHNIESKLIQEYIDEEYNRINTEHTMRIKRYYDKMNNNTKTKSNKRERTKAIEFLIKNKTFLEEKGYDTEFINNYVEKHYSVINKKYSEKNQYKIDNTNDIIAFID